MRPSRRNRKVVNYNEDDFLSEEILQFVENDYYMDYGYSNAVTTSNTQTNITDTIGIEQSTLQSKGNSDDTSIAELVVDEKSRLKLMEDAPSANHSLGIKKTKEESTNMKLILKEYSSPLDQLTEVHTNQAFTIFEGMDISRDNDALPATPSLFSESSEDLYSNTSASPRTEFTNGCEDLDDLSHSRIGSPITIQDHSMNTLSSVSTTQNIPLNFHLASGMKPLENAQENTSSNFPQNGSNLFTYIDLQSEHTFEGEETFDMTINNIMEWNNPKELKKTTRKIVNAVKTQSRKRKASQTNTSARKKLCSTTNSDNKDFFPEVEREKISDEVLNHIKSSSPTKRSTSTIFLASKNCSSLPMTEKSDELCSSKFVLEPTIASKKRRNTRRGQEAHVPLAYYLMYVDDEETPDEIMKKFAAMEQLQKESGNSGIQEGILDEEQQEKLFLLTNSSKPFQTNNINGETDDISSEKSSCDEAYLPNHTDDPSDWDYNLSLSDDMYSDSESENYSTSGITEQLKRVNKNKVQRRDRRTVQEDQTIIEKVYIFIDLRTYETFSSIQKEVSNAHGISTFQQFRSIPHNVPFHLKKLKIEAGPLKFSWGHNFEHISKRPVTIPQKFMKDDNFSFQCNDDEFRIEEVTNAKTIFITQDVLQRFDFSTLPQFENFETILLSPNWVEWEYNIDPLYMIPIRRLMGNRGYVFIWTPKILIPDVFAYFKAIGFKYADSLCWVHQDLETKKSLTLFQECSSHLYIFRMDNAATKHMNIRHQRSPDSVFDFTEPHNTVYQMIETLLPTTVEKRLHIWAPKNQAPRDTWVNIIEVRENPLDLRQLLQDAEIHKQNIVQEGVITSDDEEDYDEEMEFFDEDY